MDSVEISLLTNFGYDVNFDIEAIEHYDGVYTASNVPASSIIASDGRNPDTWVFLAYENDTSGHTASAPDVFCNGWYGVYEAYDYSGGNSDANLVNVRFLPLKLISALTEFLWDIPYLTKIEYLPISLSDFTIELLS